jgi:hypothetical protein
MTAGDAPDMVDLGAVEARLRLLEQEHRDLDQAIAALADAPTRDQLQLARLKKRKLRLRDEMASLSDQLLPDIIA